MILYNQSGEAFQIIEEDWQDLCEAAKGHGWQPGGTAPPPIRLDIDRLEPAPQEPWNHDYRVPQQQTVLRHDAKAMAAALRQVDEQARFTLREAFIEFCSRGGFILCPEPETSLHALEKSVRAAEEPLIHKNRTLQTTPFVG